MVAVRSLSQPSIGPLSLYITGIVLKLQTMDRISFDITSVCAKQIFRMASVLSATENGWFDVIYPSMIIAKAPDQDPQYMSMLLSLAASGAWLALRDPLATRFRPASSEKPQANP